jgi:hypothetical protein
LVIFTIVAVREHTETIMHEGGLQVLTVVEGSNLYGGGGVVTT